jgi:D-aminoacyl-tRNA deacylase
VIGLLQRVTQARVDVAGETLGAIGEGLVALIGVERDDQEAQAERLLERLLGYRIFSDPDGKMNLSLTEVGGGLLLVPQFTLPADTKKGMRPSFTPAASPEAGERLFTHLLARTPEGCERRLRCPHAPQTHQRWPVTFWLRVEPPHMRR